MSVCLEGNVFIDGGQIQNIKVTTSTIEKSNIDMMNDNGVRQNITNVATPINDYDAVNKKYVDDLGIVISEVTLMSSIGTTISTKTIGSFIITITNLVANGPSGVFHVTKNNPAKTGHVVRTASTPGTDSIVSLRISWPANSGILLNKTGNSSLYDGSYRIKIM